MITSEQFRQFVQSKEERMLGIITPPTLYYLRVFEIFGRQAFFLSWNWAAFSATFLGVGHLWLAYRRMYLLAVLFWIVSNSLLIGFILLAMNLMPHFMPLAEHSTLPSKIGYGLAVFLLSNLMGVFANAIYFAKARYAIRKKIASGGTNSSAVLIALIAGFIILTLVKRFGAPYL